MAQTLRTNAVLPVPSWVTDTVHVWKLKDGVDKILFAFKKITQLKNVTLQLTEVMNGLKF